MNICFLGTSHAAQHLSAAAVGKGFTLVPIDGDPKLVFVSEDTPTDENGVRHLDRITDLVENALHGQRTPAPIILTSQVTPGYSRRFQMPQLFHQAETLRIKDAAFRALNPEQMIVGCADPDTPLPSAYAHYLRAFQCRILLMSYESAEFSKMAINAFLIAQVETTNMLSGKADACGADWNSVREALMLDSRIGPKAYLTPGRWQDSKHLMRDFRTLCEGEPPFVNSLLNAWQP